MMYLAIKKLWVEGLTSGKYPQGGRSLKTPDGFCCLGVLCDLYSQAKNIAWAKTHGIKPETFLGHVGTLPEAVQTWAGLGSSRPFVGHQSLIALNDEGRSFSLIAKLIDSNL